MAQGRDEHPVLGAWGELGAHPAAAEVQFCTHKAVGTQKLALNFIHFKTSIKCLQYEVMCYGDKQMCKTHVPKARSSVWKES